MKFSNKLVAVLLMSNIGLCAAESLSLAELVHMGLAHQPLVENAVEAHELSGYDLSVSELAFTPTWSLSGSTQASKSFTDGASTDVRSIQTGLERTQLLPSGMQFVTNMQQTLEGTDNNYYETSAGFSLTQPLLKGAGLGINRIPIEQGRLRKKTSDLQYQGAMADVVDTILVQYHLYQLSLLQTDIQAKQLKTTESFVKNLTLKVDLGRAADNDLIQAQFDLSQQKVQMISVERAKKKQYDLLIVALGLDKKTQLEIQKFQSVAYELAPLDELLAEFEQENLQLIQMRFDLDSLELQKKQATNDLKWQLDLKAAWTLRGKDAQMDQAWKDWAGYRDGQSSIGLSLKVPLGDKLRREQQLHKTNVSQKAQQRLFRYNQAKLAQQLDDLYSDIEAKIIQLSLAEQAQMLAEKSYQAALMKQEAGRSSVFEVVSIQSQQKQAENNLAQARINLSMAFITLDRQLNRTMVRWGKKLDA